MIGALSSFGRQGFKHLTMSKFIILHQSVRDEDGAPTREVYTIDVNVDSIELLLASKEPFRNSTISFKGREGAASFDESVNEIRWLISNPCISGRSYET